jgi:hypothetical protein
MLQECVHGQHNTGAIMQFITVRFSCESCGLVDKACLVPARTNEDIVFYVEQIIGGAVKAKHARCSPTCTSTRMSQLKIPVNDEVGIGYYTSMVPPKGNDEPEAKQE